MEAPLEGGEETSISLSIAIDFPKVNKIKRERWRVKRMC